MIKKNFLPNLGTRWIIYADTNPINCQNSIISDRIFQQCWKERKHTHKIVVATYKIPKCWKMATMLLSSSISKSIMCRTSKRLLLSWGNSEWGKKSRIFMRSMLTFPNSNCCHATMKLQWISSTGHEIDMKSLMFYSGGTKQNVILYFFPCYTKRFQRNNNPKGDAKLIFHFSERVFFFLILKNFNTIVLNFSFTDENFKWTNYSIIIKLRYAIKYVVEWYVCWWNYPIITYP